MVCFAVVPTLSVTPGRNPTSIAKSNVVVSVGLSIEYSWTTGLINCEAIFERISWEKSRERVAMV